MRFAVIGAGGVGALRVEALRAMSECQLTAICDVDANRARSLAGKSDIQTFSDYRDALRSDAVDAVVVSTPPQFHEEITLAALKGGKPVLCEKPLANSVTACRRMVEASRKANLALATGFNFRFFPNFEFVKEALDRGLIGELNHIRAFAGHVGLSEFKAAWMYDKKVMGGGVLFDIGIHLIDMTRYLLGDVEEVFGVATSDFWKLDGSEDNAMVLLRNPQGKTATLHATWGEWRGYRFCVEAYGNKGMVKASYAPMFHMSVLQEKPGAVRKKQYNFYPRTLLEEKIFGWKATAIKAFQKEFREFIGLCTGHPGRIADGFAGLRTVEIADALYRSNEERRPVRLTPLF